MKIRQCKMRKTDVVSFGARDMIISAFGIMGTALPHI